MKLKPLLLCLMILLGGLLGLYSFDLGQNNPETLFLTKKGLAAYTQFKELVPEKKFIVFKLEFSGPVKIDDYLEMEKALESILDPVYEQVDLMTARDFYSSRKNFQKSFQGVSKLSPGIQLKGERFLAFLLMEKENPQILFKMIERIQNHTYFSSSNKKLAIAGIPYTTFLLDKYSQSIKERIFPAMFALSFLIILLITRSFVNSTILFMPCLLAAFITLASLKFLYQNMNMVTSIAPLLTFTINLSLVFHIYFSMLKYKHFKTTLKKKLPPVVLMVVTTSIGFGSLMVSEIEAIEKFGKLSSFLILLTSLSTIAWLYLSHPFLRTTAKNELRINLNPDHFAKTWGLKRIGILLLLGGILGPYLGSKIPVITDATRYFPPSSGFQDSIDAVNKTVVGSPLYQIIIRKNQPFQLHDYQKFAQFEEVLQKKLTKMNHHFQIISLTSLVKIANLGYSGEAKIPSHILAFQAIRSRFKQSIKLSYPMGSNYKITVTGPPPNAETYARNLAGIKGILHHNYPNQYQINGLYYNLMLSQKAMINVLIQSFLLAVLIVSTISLLYLKKIRVFFIFLFVNIMPVLISFIFLYSLKFSLNIATVMTYSISIGIIVDSSFHIIHSLNQKGMDLKSYIATTILPIIGSSILLIICFGLFGINEFLPIRQFGINLSIILTLGLLFDLFILPTLYLGTPNLKEYLQHEN